ncbi:glycosyltransferase family 2 protein [Pseudotabrizicola formosa]|uniref:glycosyltransferase family 2 protein n=1 Tax=Pseudotabrizicola formosa TaxID=2030009 RepID=UPI001FEEEBAF|nr:glycosyltransferase [Pseudotabrizicola formosa]
MPDPAVIIPHYNDTKRLIKCLHALLPQLASEAEVVVIDNGSTESLDQIRDLWPDLRIVTEARKGAANARNRGVAETTAQTLFFLDCDCIPAPDWFATAMAVADRADVIGGRIDVFDETPPPRTGAQAFEAVFAFDNRAYVETKGFSVTANLLTRRDVFEATGPFIHGLSEDLDWCRRATALGYRLVYAPELRVSHPSRGDWPALARKWRRLTEEGFGVNGQGGIARAKWGLRALAMPLSSLAHLPRVLTSPALSGPGERLGAAATLVRLRVLRMVWMLGQALRGR